MSNFTSSEGYDFNKPHERLDEEFGREFTIKEVSLGIKSDICFGPKSSNNANSFLQFEISKQDAKKSQNTTSNNPLNTSASFVFPSKSMSASSYPFRESEAQIRDKRACKTFLKPQQGADTMSDLKSTRDSDCSISNYLECRDSSLKKKVFQKSVVCSCQIFNVQVIREAPKIETYRSEDIQHDKNNFSSLLFFIQSFLKNSVTQKRVLFKEHFAIFMEKLFTFKSETYQSGAEKVSNEDQQLIAIGEEIIKKVTEIYNHDPVNFEKKFKKCISIPLFDNIRDKIKSLASGLGKWIQKNHYNSEESTKYSMEEYADCSLGYEACRRLVIARLASRALIQENMWAELENFEEYHGLFLAWIFSSKLSLQNQIRLLNPECKETRHIAENLKKMEQILKQKLNEDDRSNLEEILKEIGYSEYERKLHALPQPLMKTNDEKTSESFSQARIKRLKKKIKNMREAIKKHHLQQSTVPEYAIWIKAAESALEELNSATQISQSYSFAIAIKTLVLLDERFNDFLANACPRPYGIYTTEISSSQREENPNINNMDNKDILQIKMEEDHENNKKEYNIEPIILESVENYTINPILKQEWNNTPNKPTPLFQEEEKNYHFQSKEGCSQIEEAKVAQEYSLVMPPTKIEQELELIAPETIEEKNNYILDHTHETFQMKKATEKEALLASKFTISSVEKEVWESLNNDCYDVNDSITKQDPKDNLKTLQKGIALCSSQQKSKAKRSKTVVLFKIIFGVCKRMLWHNTEKESASFFVNPLYQFLNDYKKISEKAPNRFTEAERKVYAALSRLKESLSEEKLVEMFSKCFADMDDLLKLLRNETWKIYDGDLDIMEPFKKKSYLNIKDLLKYNMPKEIFRNLIIIRLAMKLITNPMDDGFQNIQGANGIFIHSILGNRRLMFENRINLLDFNSKIIKMVQSRLIEFENELKAKLRETFIKEKFLVDFLTTCGLSEPNRSLIFGSNSSLESEEISIQTSSPFGKCIKKNMQALDDKIEVKVATPTTRRDNQRNYGSSPQQIDIIQEDTMIVEEPQLCTEQQLSSSDINHRVLNWIPPSQQLSDGFMFDFSNTHKKRKVFIIERTTYQPMIQQEKSPTRTEKKKIFDIHCSKDFNHIIRFIEKIFDDALLSEGFKLSNQDDEANSLTHFDKFLKDFDDYLRSETKQDDFLQPGQEIYDTITRLIETRQNKEGKLVNPASDTLISRLINATKVFLQKMKWDLQSFINNNERREDYSYANFKNCVGERECVRRLILIKFAQKTIITEDMALEFEKLQGERGLFIRNILRAKRLSIESKIRFLEFTCSVMKYIRTKCFEIEQDLLERLKGHGDQWISYLDIVLKQSNLSDCTLNQENLTQPEEIIPSQKIKMDKQIYNKIKKNEKPDRLKKKALNENVDKLYSLIRKIQNGSPIIKNWMQNEIKFAEGFLFKHWPHLFSNDIDIRNTKKKASQGETEKQLTMEEVDKFTLIGNAFLQQLTNKYEWYKTNQNYIQNSLQGRDTCTSNLGKRENLS